LGGADEDMRLRARESEQMRLDHPDIAEGGEVSVSAAVRWFVETVLALSDNPGPENVERYLAASRALEYIRSRREPRLESRGLTKGRI
jgi:hypothetical protein